MEQQWLTPYLDRIEELSHQFFRHVQRRLEQTGISPSQYPLLRLLAARGELRISDLAALLHLSVPGVTGLVDRLVRQGLVTRRRDEADRRVVYVALSAEGRARLARAAAERREAWAELLGGLSESEVAEFVSLLERMHRALQDGQGPGSAGPGMQQTARGTTRDGSEDE
ncbi:MAG: MarR family transcriptional regulator [Firmicutes bacterium]|nr:MarR family transcriptional regulator [Bacillota bacterium]